MTTVAQSPTATQTPVAAIAHVRGADGSVRRLEANFVALVPLDRRVRRVVRTTRTGRKVAVFVVGPREFRSYIAALRSLGA